MPLENAEEGELPELIISESNQEIEPISSWNSYILTQRRLRC